MITRYPTLVLLAISSLVLSARLAAEPPSPSKLKMSVWSANGMTKDPVALTFDNKGRLYLVESARRTTVDIDIRSHREWLLEDLASQNFEDMRDFFRRRMATRLSDENKSWLQDRNGDGIHDYRDLRTISERIRLLEDTDGDRVADKATLFAKDFNEEFTGVAAGVMPHNGDVLMTVYPDLWRLRDDDGDGTADRREIMFRGFGVHAAFDGHDLHGLTIGPEGKIYFSCGDNGFSITSKEGKRLHHPNTGGVLRMNPDGTDLEVFAIGLRNVQEFDFDRYGNMFGVDNDGDLEDERERAVYIAEGSDSGWRLNWQFRAPGWVKYNGGMTYNPWTAEGMWKPQHSDQPAYITPPMQTYSVGPGGFKFNPGSALNEEYRDFFFCVQFPVKKVTAFRTRPKGAGFEMYDEHVFNDGLMVSSLNFGPDGGCYLADWIGKWQPNGEGIVYRVDDPEVDGSTLRREVERLLHDGVRSSSNLELIRWLGHVDRRVRQLAQFELVRRKAAKDLLTVANRVDAPQLARIHSLWGLIQMRATGLRLPWNDADAQLRQQCARVAGDLRISKAVPHLIELLKDESPLVRSHAAIALGKTADEVAAQPLLALLSSNDDVDPFLRHAAVMGLAGSTSSKTLAAQSGHKSAAVRMGCVLALKKQKCDLVVDFIRDQNVRVQREAIRAIHDDFSIPAGLPAVAKRLEEESLPIDEPILRRILSANLRVGDQQSAQRLVKVVMQPSPFRDLAIPMQLEALRCLAAWRQTPLVDRVEGRIRKSQRASPNAGEAALTENLASIFVSPVAEVRTEAVRIAKQLDLPVDISMLRQFVTAVDEPTSTRAEALRILHQRNVEGVDDLIEQALDGDWTRAFELRKVAFQSLVERAPASAFSRIDMTAPLPVRRFFIAQLPKIKTAESEQMLADLLAEQAEGNGSSTITPDVLVAARQRNSRKLKPTLQAAADRFSKHALGEFQFSAEPGDAKRGELIYRTHVNAQCVRCHNAGGQGKQAGPELTGIGSRVDKSHLLESLIEPSAKITKGFESVVVITDDGKVLRGTVVYEDENLLTLGTIDGKKEAIDKSNIDERSAQLQSAMPSMREVLTPIEVRDLVEYLSTLK